MSCVGAQAGGPSSIGLVVGSGDRDRRVGEGGKGGRMSEEGGRKRDQG